MAGLRPPQLEPTRRGKAGALSAVDRDRVDGLQPNRTAIDAREAARARADARDAEGFYSRHPLSFDCSDRHARNVWQFVGAIDRRP